ncbi:MAG TPA: 4,5-DOPA dioxygenase extradiol [Casimicrobium sp.]|nr:4,5-DOPA dioxygenase extradiol [Casimicrobium sp.]
MTSSSATTSLSDNAFGRLTKSPRMPVMFVGHGSPMNAIEDNAYRRSWQALGAQFGTGAGAKYPTPQLILCISAHWLTRGWWMTGMAKPKTIHDFGGFPQALFDQQYPAPGAPVAAKSIAQSITTPSIALDDHEWGFDHGTWSVIKPMFPAATIPVVQLSMDYGRAPSEHFAIGQQLAKLRDHGVLIVGSGNIVHNLRAMRMQAPGGKAYDWAIEFDRVTAEILQSGNNARLNDFQKLGQTATLAHPTYEHYLPLLYAAGAVGSNESVRFFNDEMAMASISMRSTIWG